MLTVPAFDYISLEIMYLDPDTHVSHSPAPIRENMKKKNDICKSQDVERNYRALLSDTKTIISRAR